MKNMMKTATMLVMALAMYACGGSNSPKDVAEKSVKCLQKADYEGYVDLIYLEDMEGEEMNKAKQEFAGMLKEKASKSIEKEEGIKSYEVLSEEIAEDGNKATVKMKITYGNGKEKNETIKLRKDDKDNWKLDIGK